MTSSTRHSPAQIGDERLFQVARRHGCTDVVRSCCSGSGVAHLSVTSVPPRVEHGAQGATILADGVRWAPGDGEPFPVHTGHETTTLLLAEVPVGTRVTRRWLRALAPALRAHASWLLVGVPPERSPAAGDIARALAELRRELAAAGVEPEFSGTTGAYLGGGSPGVVAISRSTASRGMPRNGNGTRDVPGTFNVVAFVVAYNEVDIIGASLAKLVDDGVRPYLVDNWSTDGTAERASRLLGTGLFGLERFPPEGPSRTYEWERLLGRVEELTRSLEADWFVHHDADQFRLTPWGPGVTLREGIRRVDAEGYNAIDFTLLDFPPVDDSYEVGMDPEAHFRRFTPTLPFGNLANVTAWKHTGAPVDLRRSGGHQAEFDGRAVYPYNFLLKHVPIRSQEHGERKVFRDRKARFSPTEREEKGWHVHYDHVEEGYSFVADPETLTTYDDRDFADDYVLERLYGFDVPSPEPPYLQWLVHEQDRRAEALEDAVRTLEAEKAVLEVALAELRDRRVPQLEARLSTAEAAGRSLDHELERAQERCRAVEARLDDVERSTSYAVARRLAEVVACGRRAARVARQACRRVQERS